MTLSIIDNIHCMMKRLTSLWKRSFAEEVDENLIYTVAVERILQMEDFQEDDIWVSSFDYKNAEPNPLREFANNIISEWDVIIN